MPGRRRCGGAGGGPCRPEPTSSWSPRLAVVSPGNGPGSGHYDNGPETPPLDADAVPADPEPGPKDGPDSREETQRNTIIRGQIRGVLVPPIGIARHYNQTIMMIYLW